MEKTLEMLKKRLAPHPEAWEIDGICAICGKKATEFLKYVDICVDGNKKEGTSGVGVA